MPILNDRQRVELCLPARMLESVFVSGIEAGAHELEEVKDLKALFRTVVSEPLDGLPPAKQASLRNRVARTMVDVMQDFARERQKADRVGATVFYFTEALLSSGYLELHEGSGLARAFHLLIPHMRRVFGSEALDAGAREQAREMLGRLQRRHGLYAGVTMPEEMAA